MRACAFKIKSCAFRGLSQIWSEGFFGRCGVVPSKDRRFNISDIERGLLREVWSCAFRTQEV
jgi:hypothetical protein